MDNMDFTLASNMMTFPMARGHLRPENGPIGIPGFRSGPIQWVSVAGIPNEKPGRAV